MPLVALGTLESKLAHVVAVSLSSEEDLYAGFVR
uniref:Uncharacterized protein n=1 Tax=Ralstonia solanacearum TaxID=305 RepID=A0A0S4TMT4_RALSL|nr:protein of unknown function [Ralstonia solanacearum]